MSRVVVPVRSRTVQAFGASATVRVEGGPATLVGDAVDRLRALERCWSPDHPDGALARLNRSAGIPRVVEPDLFVLVEFLLDRWRATAGWFDPTVRSRGVAAVTAATVTEPARVLAPPAEGCAAIRVDADRRMVWAPVGVHLHPRGCERDLAVRLVTAEVLAAGAAAVDVHLARRPPAPVPALALAPTG